MESGVILAQALHDVNEGVTTMLKIITSGSEGSFAWWIDESHVAFKRNAAAHAIKSLIE
jgi:hypothetical protein